MHRPKALDAGKSLETLIWFSAGKSAAQRYKTALLPRLNFERETEYVLTAKDSLNRFLMANPGSNV